MYDKGLKERSDSVDTLDGIHMEVEVSRSYSVQEKLSSTKYSAKFLINLDEITFKRIQEYGFTEPIKVTQKSGLGMY